MKAKIVTTAVTAVLCFSSMAYAQERTFWRVRCDQCAVLSENDPMTQEAAVVGLQGYGAAVQAGDGVTVYNEGGTISCSEPLFQRFHVLRAPVVSTADIQFNKAAACEPFHANGVPHSLSGWSLTEHIIMGGNDAYVFNCHFNSNCS